MKNETTTTISTVTIPAGSYYLGDPCYVVNEEEWSPTVNQMFDEKGRCVEGKIIPVSNGIVMSFSTKHGDGSFVDNMGNEYPVDSGTIGLVSTTHNPEFSLTDLVNPVTFYQDTVCTLDSNGFMDFGGIIQIDTNGLDWSEYDNE